MYEDVINTRKITRLCHFTKSKNLPFILGDGIDSNDGILANNFIEDTSFLDKTDVNRYDKHEDFICTSIQYPNCYYFSTVLKRNVKEIFNDWVILFIDPSVIDESTKFCPVNAATKGGRLIKQGSEAFEGMFAHEVMGKQVFYRPTAYQDNVPTNIQGEVLIYKEIPKEHIMGLAFPTDEIAENECLRLELCGVDLEKYNVITSSDLFKKDELLTILKQGEMPDEKVLKNIKHG